MSNKNSSGFSQTVTFIILTGGFLLLWFGAVFVLNTYVTPLLRKLFGDRALGITGNTRSEKYASLDRFNKRLNLSFIIIAVLFGIGFFHYHSTFRNDRFQLPVLGSVFKNEYYYNKLKILKTKPNLYEVGSTRHKEYEQERQADIAECRSNIDGPNLHLKYIMALGIGILFLVVLVSTLYKFLKETINFTEGFYG